MGIDVYLRYKGMTSDERKAQITGFSVTSGCVGYLREAYHGGPYATRVLAPEAFDADRLTSEQRGAECPCWPHAPDADGCLCGFVYIPPAVLRSRLPAVIVAAVERERVVYGNVAEPRSRVVKAFRDFVALAERWEKEGKRPVIYASF